MQTLDEIIAQLDRMGMSDAALWFVEHMTYDAPHRMRVMQYLWARRNAQDCSQGERS